MAGKWVGVGVVVQVEGWAVQVGVEPAVLVASKLAFMQGLS
jgi:hypothetical protein